MARKKIVFVIVEGPSDEEALGVFLNRIYDRNTVYIHIVHGDLTTRPGSIRNKIADAVRGYADSTHLKKSDFQEVIHIVDMDGAYVPEEAVIEDISAQVNDDLFCSPLYDYIIFGEQNKSSFTYEEVCRQIQDIREQRLSGKKVYQFLE